MRTAQFLAPSISTSTDQPIDVDRARTVAQRWGWTDGQLAALALRVPPGTDLSTEVRNQLSVELGNLEVNRAGVAVCRSQESRTVLILLSRRLVRLVPVRARVPPGQRLTIAGVLRTGAPPTGGQVRIALEMPDGSLRHASIPTAEHGFEHQINTGRVTGILKAELLVDRGHGPEIAAVFPVGVGVPAHSSSISPLPAEPRDLLSAGEAEVALAELILGNRQARELTMLTHSTLLANTARSHASDMVAQGFFAHVSPTTGDLTDRLRARHLLFVRAVENIAVADSADGAFQQWMASPAHRANLEDPRVTTFGVGVATTMTPNGRQRYYAVVVLARLSGDEGNIDLRARVLRSLGRRRDSLGGARLRRDRVLERLAERHSREMASLGRVTDISPVHGHLVDAVFDEIDVSEAAADVYCSTSVDVVSQSQHLAGRYTRVGVGIHRDGTSNLWVTVIYATD
jgi:uncharacterized protein YkwD